VRTILISIVLGALIGPVAFAAQKKETKATAATSTQAKTKPAPGRGIRHLSGEIVSFTDSSMVVSHGAWKQKTTFVLNPETKREGTLKVGEKVKVEYQIQGKENTATLVHVGRP
jgi:Cu/Ag efflux protein CusF